MLVELDIRDFAIIDHLRIRFAPGFNVLTGETGAGKSIVVDALSQLLGDRASADMIRAESGRAFVEGVFEIGPSVGRIAPVLEAYGVEPDEQLILGREIQQGGRSLARANGRAVPVRALADLGAVLIDIHGQSDNTSLKRESEHVELLDRYGELEAPRSEMAELVKRERALAAELAHLREDEAALARRADMLAFQVDQIRSARLSAEEESELLAERTRLANAERLAVLADEAYAALRGGQESQPAALDQLDLATEAVRRLAAIDPSFGDLPNALADAAAGLGDAASRLIDYRDRLEFNPDRLSEVEERLGAIHDLKRKFGPDIASVLAYADQADSELATISNAAERIEQLVQARSEIRDRVGRLGSELSLRRREVGERLADAVVPEMAMLGMPGSVFEVRIERRPDPEGVLVDGQTVSFDETGLDRVAFLVSTNPGEPALPLARVASGGETARIMLALKTILTTADRTPTLIFDEIDAGIGGRIGAVAGQRLWSLAGRHQVLCVTHLPQVAAYADAHVLVRKAVASGRTTTEAEAIGGEERVHELAMMLGSPTSIAHENAVQLLQHSESWKSERSARQAV
jgi:DNA repair protein RecN (Recombination protein N)